MLRFDIYIRGFGPGRESGAERLARAFGLPLSRAQELVRSLPRVVKRGVPQAQIERYARLLDEIGADCELRPSPIAPAQVIAIGTGGNTLADALEQDGSMMTLPPPAEEHEAVWQAPHAEATALGSADTLRRQADAPSGEPVRVSRPGNETWVEGRGSGAGSAAGQAARGPNDTLVESRPPGAMSGSVPPPPVHVPAPAPPPSFEVLDQRAPDARVMQMHAPTVRSFNTLTEAAAPTTTETLRRDEPWPSAPAAGPAPYAAGSRPLDRTQPQAAPAPFASSPPPPAAAYEPLPVAGPAHPVVASMRAPALADPPAPLSQAWVGIAPAPVPGAHSAAEAAALQAAAASPHAPVAVAASAFELPLIGREEYAELAAQQGQVGARAPGVRGLEPPVVHAPGVWEGRLTPGSNRPPAMAAPPPTALHGALRKSTRPAPMMVPERDPELPIALRWALRIGIGVALFVIVGTLRQCRAVNDDVEQSLARWEARPSAHGGSLAGAREPVGPGATPARPTLGPVAVEWLKSDFNQVANGDKDRVRGLIERFEAAGAVEVYVGTISELGMTKVGGELLVLLPADAARRAAVLEVHQAMLRATFGGFAPPSRPEGDLLRVTL